VLASGALVRDLEAALPSVGTARPPTIASTEPMAPVTQDRHAPPPPSRSPDAAPPAQRRGWLLPALVCIGALLLGGAWLAFSGGAGDSGKKTKRSKQAAAHKQGGGSPTKSAAATPTTPTTDTAAPPAEAVPSTSASDPGAAGSQLNDEGYSLIQQGRYVEAIPVLRRAVASFPQGTTDLNLAYALFNLGHALRMAGHPEKAIPILEQRLGIPDQTETVQAELDAARAAAGG